MFKNLFKKKPDPSGGSVIISNPIKGEVIKLEKVPDEVFAQRMLGEGFAVNPTQGAVYSPIDGEIKALFPTLHAIAMETDGGLELLIHIGIDTVELNGQGFTSNIKLGDKVKKGDLLIQFDIELIKDKGKIAVTPIIITNMDKVKEIEFEYGRKGVGDKVMTVQLK